MAFDSRDMAARGKIGGYARAAKYCPDELTGAARQGFMARFYRDLPDGLSQEEADRRARALLNSHMARLALKSAKARAR